MSPGVPEPFSPPWPDYKVDPGSDIHSNISPHLTEGTWGNIALNRDRKPELCIQVDFEFPESVVESSNSKCCANIHQPHSWDSVMQKASRFFHWLTPRCPNVPCPEVWNSVRLRGPGHICPEDNAAVSSVLPLEVSLWHKDLPPTPDFSKFLISRIIYRISFRSMVYSLPVW